MKTIDARLRKLLGDAPKTYWEEKISSQPGYWGERILSQLVFAHEVSKVEGYRYNEPIEAALSYVEQQIAEEGVIGKHTALHAESMLIELAAVAKSYDIICAAHAHIDMNWMWPWDETVAVTIDTFRTMLNLLNEYPEFTFSQSQASIYRIVEQYAPDMLEEIKERVKEGRWEVTASHWVEADKNMPNGESLARHLLYTKRYLSQLFDLDPDSLNLDFEPDTFGHSVNVPEILANGGVKFYYHCRGNDGHIVYRWQAPSGKSVIVYREPTWYNDSVQPILGSYVPEICRQTGLKTYLNVYGVGDHGGGPTRRDLERIMDMNDWPIYPQIRFGTFSEYYKLIEPIADKLPVVTGEINFVFTGCYTSQTRIKTANRIGEATLNEAETFSSAAAVAAGSAYPGAAYEEAWRNVLFNQFHDILPGSGVIETREHALGLFQNTMAIASTNRKLALERIAATINTSQWSGPEDKLTVSEGAGVGYGTREFKITQVERGRGNTRIVHFFNSAVYDREETAEFVLWDWNSPIKTLIVRDSEGRDTAHQVIDEGFNPYWGHHYMRLLVYVKAPACGYSTYTISEGEGSVNPFLPTDPRVERENKYVLENDVLQVTFHPVDATVISMIHKKTGTQMIDASRPAGLFRLIQEDTVKGMSAWYIGRYMKIENAHSNVKLKMISDGSIRQSLQYELECGASKLKVIVSLDRNTPRLDFQVECDWHEIGKSGIGIPQLNFHWPLAYESVTYKYDVPFGTILRKPLDMDVPGNSWALGVRDAGKPSVMLVTNNKYGFRGTDNALSVSLIRSSYDPDPYPELGNHHRISIGVCVMESACDHELIEIAYRFNHPFNVLSGTSHTGTRPLDGGFLKLTEGKVVVAAVKMPEQDAGKRWIIRAYETEGQRTTATLQLFQAVSAAYYVDMYERKVTNEGTIQASGKTVTFEVPAYSVASICLEFE
ncbi:glycoside hydrolase family 38 N-terminal domain-containing protein [Paenibacillus sp. FSL H8-0034]|uniref:glycoside hydrolase family 38 N-terminal domain-containing protein n=1 Tax=Paenibacillus sp. FSL H8-0034 TaxID=2954671 RepID=UPI0030FB1F37